MRILQVGKYYPPVRGGMETALRHMCEGLLARGHEVVALVAGTDSFDQEERPTRPDAGRMRIVRAGALAVFNSQPLVPSLPALLRRELHEFAPDIVHLHLPHPGACATCLALLPRDCRPRLAIWYHADITRQRLGRRLVRPLLQRCLRRSAGIAVSSEALRDGSPILAGWRDKIRVIPFGIDPAPWSELTPHADGPFLFIGRLVYYKGLDLLLAAIADLPEARLVIVGDGPLRGDIRGLVRARGLEARVRLTGEIDGAGLRREMGAARALVLSSDQPSETFGLVQLEAMAAGLPVISTELPTGVAEVNVHGETGLVVPPGDAAALAAALRTLQEAPALAARLGCAGRRRVAERFSAARMVGQLAAWYLELVDGDRAGAAR